MKQLFLGIFLFYCCFFPLFAELDVTSFEKGMRQKNEDLIHLKKQLYTSYQKASTLYESQADPIAYQTLLKEIQTLKEALEEKERSLKTFSQENLGLEDSYILSEQGDLSLSKLIMEYGSPDYLYIFPPDMGNIKLHLVSSLPLPRACWDEMIDMILSSNGIGIKKVNPYVRSLYWLKQIPSHIEVIATKPEDLSPLPDRSRVFYLLSPEPDEVKAVQTFLERFSDPKETFIHPLHSQLAIISFKENICKLLTLYEASWNNDKGKKQVKVLHFPKLGLKEGEKILKAFFPEPSTKGRTLYPIASGELTILMLPYGLVVIGDGSSIAKAEAILEDIERQLEDPLEMSLFWYTCKHTNPDEISDILKRVYNSLSGMCLRPEEKKGEVLTNKEPEKSSLVVSPPFVTPGTIPPEKKRSLEENFIVDAKSGSILMVVRKDLLPKIQQLLQKLDTPKKMVQIEVLLVEKKHQDRKQMGASMLRLGSPNQRRETALNFDTRIGAINKGILEFLLARPRGNLPSIDLAYHFLMGQEDLQINASPSVLTTNQTPASISIVEEISINNGVVQVDAGTSGVVLEKSFSRAQYGTVLVLTPTIHMPEDLPETEKGFITLNTDITFDTAQLSEDSRPPVTRRHIVNEIRVADGETIILGGLRRKSQQDSHEKIPFLGDLPGFGKLFGYQRQSEANTEMFIFITPKIVQDPLYDLQIIRKKELEKRAGDIPAFLQRLEEAKRKEKQKIFEDSLNLIFG